MRDGWFGTGDIGRIDAEGFLFLVGRKTAVINLAGRKVFPEEIEAVLNRHPAVRESRVSRPAAQPATKAVAEPARPRTMLLEGLKEELFELEVEHKQGQISQQEYEKTKAALDQTLQRALKRESQKA